MPFAAKSEMVWYFIGVYIINRTLHGRLEIRNFSSRVFSTLEEKFRISVRPSSIYLLLINFKNKKLPFFSYRDDNLCFYSSPFSSGFLCLPFGVIQILLQLTYPR